MAFCEFCGRKLEDGEVCNCTSATPVIPAPAADEVKNDPAVEAQVQAAEPMIQVAKKSSFNLGAGFGNFFKLFPATFKKPLDAPYKYFEEADLGTSVAAGIIMFAVYWLAGIFRMTSGILFYRYATIGGWIMAIFFPFIWATFALGATFGTYALINKIFIKKPMSIPRLAAFVTAPAVATILAMAIGYVDVFIPVQIYILPFAQILLLMVAFIQGLYNLKKVIEDNNKFVFAALIAGGIFLVTDIFLLSMFGLIPTGPMTIEGIPSLLYW